MGKKGKKTRWRELPITTSLAADKPYAAHDQQQQQQQPQQPQQPQSNRQSADAKPVNFAAAAGRRGHHGQHQHQQQQYHHHYQQQQPQHQSPNRNHSAAIGQQRHHVESSTVTFNEDEYTKITTPRQDVLFKKGYLGRRKHASVPVIAEIINENEDGVSSADTIMNPSDEMMCAPGEYVDPSAMYILNGAGYEVYDPYTGNPVTVLMGPPPGHYPTTVGAHPMLAAMPYQPMPVHALDWYPSAGEHWMSPPPVYQPNRHHHHKKSCTSDAQQSGCGGAQNNSDAANDASSADDHQQSLYAPQPYGLYPGYVFPAPPLYGFNGMSIQVPLQSPPSPSVSCDYANGKRRKKKKRRKRGGAGVTDEYSDSSSEEQKSQSGASSDLVPDSGKTSDSGVQTNNSGGSTPVNVTPAVQLSHNAPPFHMECARPFEIALTGAAPVFLHRHGADPATAYYRHPIPQYAVEPRRPASVAGHRPMPDEAQTAAAEAEAEAKAEASDPRPDGGRAAGYSAENSDSGISSPNSETAAAVKAESEKPLHKSAGGGGKNSGGGAAAQTAPKKSRNKKSGNKQRGDKTLAADAGKSKCNGDQAQPQQQQQQRNREGGKKSSKIAKEPAIIKTLNAKKAARGCCRPETAAKNAAARRSNPDVGEEPDETGRPVTPAQLTIGGAPDEWTATALQQDDEPFFSPECTPRSAADHAQFQFARAVQLSVDSCESAEEETFATAVNGTGGGNSDAENEPIRLHDGRPATVADGNIDPGGWPPADAAAAATAATVPAPLTTATAATVPAPLTTAGPITEAVTKWLNDQGGLVLVVADDVVYDGGSSTDVDSEYDDFEEHPAVTNSPKNARSNPYPAPSRSNGSRVAGPSSSSSSSSSPPPSSSSSSSSSSSVPALPSSNEQRKTGLVSSGICCLTQ